MTSLQLPEQRQIEVALGRQHILHEPVRRDEQNRASGLHQPVPYGAHRVRLAGARHTERKHVDAPVHEVTLGKPDELLPELHGRPLVLEGIPRLAGR